jgi:soluble lytic murein transglycosylase-like protein
MRQSRGTQNVQKRVIHNTVGGRLSAGIHQALNRIPVLWKAQAAMVVFASVACSAVVLLDGDRGVERTPFAVPAAISTQAAWNEEVSGFAKRLHRALGIPRSTATEFSGWILEASKRQGLSPELLASVVFIESSFRKNVTSDMGAIGPAQVKPYWSPFCGSANLSDPAENIYCGAQILAHYRDLCGDEQCALSAYNVGMKNQRDDAYYQELGLRYAKSIDRHVSRLSKTFL